MKENKFEKSKDKSLTEVPAILKSLNTRIINRNEIKELVEEPLVKACEIFWDKNIKTYDSSANAKDIKSGVCHIRLDYESLSEENREVAREYGEPYSSVGYWVTDINIPAEENITVKEIENKSVEIANEFYKQAPVWMIFRTVEDQLSYNEAYLEKYPDAVAREKERLTKPGAWEEECKRLGKYFDPETQTSWDSEECYQKAKEYFEYE